MAKNGVFRIESNDNPTGLLVKKFVIADALASKRMSASAIQTVR